MMAIIKSESIHPEFIHNILHTWPDSAWDGWYRYSGHYGEKLATLHARCLPIECVAGLGVVAEHVLQTYHKIIIDWSLHGAGMHQISEGGSLPAHYDAECHPRNKEWIRAVSAVLFLDTMAEDQGGELIVAGQVICPKRGTLVMFETANCLHEVKQVNYGQRRTLALFGYVSGNTSGMRSHADFVQKKT